MSIREAIEDATMEAEQIRARHDGIHAIHNCVCNLRLLRDVADAGQWSINSDTIFRDTMRRLRVIDRTGFGA